MNAQQAECVSLKGLDGGVDVKEASRKYRQTVFDFSDWKLHRSSQRYLYNLRTIPESRVLRGLLSPTLGITGFALLVACYNTAAEAGLVPRPPPDVVVSTTPFSLTASALGLLLVFRTNSSYARWLEARSVWGRVVNRTRDLARQTMAWFPPSDADLRAQMMRHIAAYPHALRTHLREGGDGGAAGGGVLSPDEAALLESSPHRPLQVLQMLTTIAGEAGLSSVRAALVDQNLTELSDAVGVCERILRTPIPLAYTRHTARFLMLYLLCLPFGLWASCKWTMVPAVLFISLALLGIEDLGVQIEEPFTILPLDKICATAQASVETLAGAQAGCRALLPPRIAERDSEAEAAARDGSVPGA